MSAPDSEENTMLEEVRRSIRRSSYCALATASAKGEPHVVGVLYAFVGTHFYVITKEDSLKVRNVRTNPHVAACIPVKKYPLAPPFSIQFRATARILSREDPEITTLLQGGSLKRIVGHGVLDQPGMCFLKIEPAGKIHTWGIGVSAWTLLRDPVGADRAVEWA